MKSCGPSRKELAELEHATNRLYKAVEKDLLPLDDLLRDRAQRLKARRDAVLVEMAGARRHKEMPAALLSSKQVQAGSALRTWLMDASSGATKRHLRQFVGAIRFNGNRVVMRGKKAALLAAAAEKEMGTAGVPISVHDWLPVCGALRNRRITFPRPERLTRSGGIGTACGRVQSLTRVAG